MNSRGHTRKCPDVGRDDKKVHLAEGGEYSVSKDRLSGNLRLLTMDINMDTGNIDAYSVWIQDCWRRSDGIERVDF